MSQDSFCIFSIDTDGRIVSQGLLSIQVLTPKRNAILSHLALQRTVIPPLIQVLHRHFDRELPVRVRHTIIHFIKLTVAVVGEVVLSTVTNALAHGRRWFTILTMPPSVSSVHVAKRPASFDVQTVLRPNFHWFPLHNLPFNSTEKKAGYNSNAF